jgi:hypothetical protein
VGNSGLTSVSGDRQGQFSIWVNGQLKFAWKKFAEIDVNDAFFNSLKEDYAEFPDWFRKKVWQVKMLLFLEMNKA